jgi:FkbM family methyltransferase
MRVLRFIIYKLRLFSEYAKVMRNPHDLILQYAGLWQHRYIPFFMRNGDVIMARTKPLDDREVLLHVYGDEHSDYSACVLPPGGVVMDVGANIGTFSVRFGRQCSKLIAFEPHPGNFRLLEANLRLNALEGKAVAYQAAVAEASGRRRFYAGNSPARFSLFEEMNPDLALQGGEEFDVECMTLRQAIESNKLESVDLLKLDCEGAEYPILMKMDSRTLSKIRSMIIEHHVVEGHPREDIIRRLEKDGFAVSIIKEHDVSSILHATRIR